MAPRDDLQLGQQMAEVLGMPAEAAAGHARRDRGTVPILQAHNSQDGSSNGAW
jgi:hypothetical protein